MRRVLAAAALLGLAGGLAAAAPAKPGRPAPGFTLRDQSGKTVTLASLRGRIVVLEWMNPDCPFWIRHAKAGTMRKLAGEFGPRGVAWFAVNSTAHMPLERDQWARVAFGLPYPVLNDRKGKAGRAYGAKTTPDMFVIDPAGKLAYCGAIDDDPGGERGSGAVNHVRRALEDLLAGRPVAVPETRSYGCSVKYANKGHG